MPVIQDGNAYKYYVSSPSHYIQGSTYIDVTQDVDCPVYFAMYIDYSQRCSDSLSYSCSSSFT